MEIFHSFDGTMSWESLKRRISGLTFEGLVAHKAGKTPDKPKIINLTSAGKEVIKEFGFSEDATTEDFPEVK